MIGLSLMRRRRVSGGLVNLVQNGNGNAVDGWSGARGGETVTATGGRIRATSDDGTTMGVVQEIVGLALVPHNLKIDIINPFGLTFFLRFQTASPLNAGSNIYTGTDASYMHDGSVTPPAATSYLGVIVTGAAASEYFEIDNISLTVA